MKRGDREGGVKGWEEENKQKKKKVGREARGGENKVGEERKKHRNNEKQASWKPGGQAASHLKHQSSPSP